MSHFVEITDPVEALRYGMNVLSATPGLAFTTLAEKYNALVGPEALVCPKCTSKTGITEADPGYYVCGKCETVVREPEERVDDYLQFMNLPQLKREARGLIVSARRAEEERDTLRKDLKAVSESLSSVEAGRTKLEADNRSLRKKAEEAEASLLETRRELQTARETIRGLVEEMDRREQLKLYKPGTEVKLASGEEATIRKAHVSASDQVSYTITVHNSARYRQKVYADQIVEETNPDRLLHPSEL